MSHPLHIGAMLALSLLPFGACCAVEASEADERSVSVDAFGTLGAVHSDYRQADFVVANPFMPRGVGHSRRWASDQDTKLGLQLSADAGRFSAVVQGITKLRYDNTFKPELEWANVKFAITPDLSVRAGRVVLPTFLSSDTENVGYVRPWVRTPGEIRVQLPMTNSDGIDLTYQFETGAVSHRLQVLFGQNEENLPENEVFQNKRIRTLTDTLEHGPLTVHLGYQKMEYRVTPNPEKYDFEAFDIGVAYDPGAWYAIAEQFNTFDDAMGNARASSLGGGYRFGNLTPYLVWSKIEQSSVGSLGARPVLDQRTVATGVRWDFARNMDLKLQYESVEIGTAIIPASFINLQPGMQVGDRVNVISATLDFVW